jgi:hypothetical protein
MGTTVFHIIIKGTKSMIRKIFMFFKTIVFCMDEGLIIEGARGCSVKF